ncbi:MAG TPA: tail fiber domain-containing protein [Pyrinomonadaceae bacterium]
MSDGKLDLPTEEATRTNYFTSQFLVEDDFKNEQAYHLEMRRLHNRALHLWGVVDGLVVKKEGPQSVSVGPGMAIDKDGKEIILIQASAPMSFDTNPPGPGALFVVLSYKDNDQDQKYIYTGTGLPDTNKRYTRIVETWDLEVSANAPDDGSVIKLASLTVDKSGLVGDPDNNVRRMAGSSVPRGSWLGSQDLYIGADGKVGVGTTTPSEKFQVNSGNLLVKGTDNFTASPHEGRVYLGDNNHYIKSVWGSGVRIGTIGQADAITLLQDGGKVGIGTTQPGQRLEVAGALKLSTNPSVSNDQAAAYLWNQASVGPTVAGAQFEVRTGGDTPRLRIDASGKVGVGVTNPAALLQAGITPVNIGGATFPSDAIAMLTCRETNVGTIPRKPVLVFAREGQAGASYANFARFDLGVHDGYRTQLDIGLSNERLDNEGNNTPVIMSLRSNGNVGIGTTTPGFPLSFGNVLGDKISLWGQSGNHFGFGIQTSLLQIHTDTSVADIAFGYGSSGKFTEVMRIKGTGNVGIGTTDQNVKLKIDTSGGTISSLKCDHNGSNFIVRPLSGGGNSTVIENTGGGALLINPGGGNVGIGTGTTNPAIKLHVVGNNFDFPNVSGTQQSDGHVARLQDGSGFLTLDMGGFANSGFWLQSTDVTNLAKQYPLLLNPNGGNVGIGTGPNVPTDAALQIVQTASASGRRDLLEIQHVGYNALLLSGFGSGHAVSPSTVQLGAWNGEQNISIVTDAQTTVLAGGSTKGIFIKSGGNVGIGTTAPTQAKLVVSGGVNALPVTDKISYFSQHDSPGNLISNWDPNDAFTHGYIGANVSIYATDNIWTSQNFVASSDERMKSILGRSDGATDLRTLLGIEITDYRYKDVIGKGHDTYKKVIGQQVEKVFPQAVSKQTGVVPDIYRQASIRDGWVALATALKRGERVKLITEKGVEGVHEVLEVTSDKFRVDFKHEGEQVFVFGREVRDFRTVDYEAIAMLNVSATQQLKKLMDEEVKALRAENAGLRARLDALESAVELCR